MNEKIKLLAEQADIETVNTIDYGGGRIDNVLVKEFNKEKFAELIIQECINACGEDYGAQLVYQHWYK